MKTIEFFDRKGYNPKYETIGGEVMMDGICVGNFRWTFHRDGILFDIGDDSTHYSAMIFRSFEECAKRIAECNKFTEDHDKWDGAMHLYFDTKKGYEHISNHLRCFPLVKKYTVTIEA